MPSRSTFADTMTPLAEGIPKTGYEPSRLHPSTVQAAIIDDHSLAGQAGKCRYNAMLCIMQVWSWPVIGLVYATSGAILERMHVSNEAVVAGS